MSRWNAYLNTSQRIIASYNGNVPLSAWLKEFFSANRKMGSTDRKWITGAVYAYFRLGHALQHIPVEERLLAALFLCHTTSHELLQQVRPAWNNAVGQSLPEKLKLLEQSVPSSCLDDIFPWQDQLSDGIEKDAFNLSHLQQPDVFIRIRPGKHERVISRIREAGIGFTQLSRSCIAMPNGSRIDQLLALDGDAVIQDYSSQQTGRFLSLPATGGSLVKLWDCCAASGGKSIMAYDLDPAVQLTVTDIRESILHNLRKRFQNAGITHYKALTADLTQPLPSHETYSLILADLPCSGSGTWSRTPEQLYFFKKKKIDEYSALQKKILQQVIPQLRPGGRLVYITCSVFKNENEDVVDFARDHGTLELEQMEVLKGYSLKADSMFVAVLKK